MRPSTDCMPAADHQSIVRLCCRQISISFGGGGSGQVEGMVAGATQDNANLSSMLEPEPTPWRRLDSGDGGLCVPITKKKPGDEGPNGLYGPASAVNQSVDRDVFGAKIYAVA